MGNALQMKRNETGMKGLCWSITFKKLGSDVILRRPKLNVNILPRKAKNFHFEAIQELIFLKPENDIKLDRNTQNTFKIPLHSLRNIKPIWVLDVEIWVGLEMKPPIQSQKTEDITKIRLALNQKHLLEPRATSS